MHRFVDFKTQTLSPTRRMEHSRDCVKYVIVTGGVLSGLGKGISTSSIGVLLKSKGLKVCPVKIDPYLNVDAGTMNPYQHGEVFVLDDGSEVDLDLGNYERFLDVNLTGDHNITTGKVYRSVIEKERRGDYLGKTVQIIPHITDEIKALLREVGEKERADDLRRAAPLRWAGSHRVRDEDPRPAREIRGHAGMEGLPRGPEEPEEGSHDRAGGQVHPSEGFVHQSHRGVPSRECRRARACEVEVGRVRRSRETGHETPRGRRWHPGPGRFRGPRDRGENRGDPLRSRERGPVPRRVPRIPAGHDRIRAGGPGPERREQFRVRSEDPASGRRPLAGAARGQGNGRDDAPRGPSDCVGPEVSDGQDVRNDDDPRATSAPLRDQSRVHRETRGRGPPVRRALGRRSTHGGVGAEGTSVLRRVPVPPRAAIPSAAAVSDSPRARSRSRALAPQPLNRPGPWTPPCRPIIRISYREPRRPFRPR